MCGSERPTAVRRAALHPEHLPVPIYTAGSDEPISATEALIVRFPDENPARVRFVLSFLGGEREPLTHFQYDTLEIALDQAAELAGIAPDHWDTCSEPVSDEFL